MLPVPSGSTASHVFAEAGTYSITVTATDTNNAVGSQAVSMTVNPPTIVVSTAALSTTATAGQAYTPAAVTASGGTSPYTYAIGSGALPAGMSLAGDGTLSRLYSNNAKRAEEHDRVKHGV